MGEGPAGPPLAGLDPPGEGAEAAGEPWPSAVPVSEVLE
jgi:hypothetical protein